jgi:uncharacterized membrane protein YheB (UPF0754 family)
MSFCRYCAKLIHGWGGRLGTLAETEEGKRLMSELNEIDINDVRFLIKRLIKGGYDRKIPARPSEQDTLTSLESSLLVVEHLARIRDDVHDFKSSVEQQAIFLQDAIIEVCSMLQHVFLAQETAQSNMSKEFEELFSSLRTNQLDHDDVDEMNQAIDSDEEAKLFEELDMLMEAQERADTFRGNVHQLMAQTFQRVSRRLLELETAYDLVSVITFAQHDALKTYAQCSILSLIWIPYFLVPNASDKL